MLDQHENTTDCQLLAMIKDRAQSIAERLDYMGLTAEELTELVYYITDEYTAWNIDNSADNITEAVDDIENRYCCILEGYQTPANYAEEIAMQYIDDCGDKIPTWITAHVDWQAVWDRELRFDYTVYELATHTVIMSNY